MGTLIGVVLPYAALLVFLAGAAFRVAAWAKAPKKLNWRLYPVPEGLAAETGYILEEWLSFKTLFRHNRAIWLGSYAFHVCLVALALWFLFFLAGLSLPWLVRIGSVGMFGSAVYLLVARLWIPQVRCLSSPVEFFNLALFAAISWAGMSLMGEGLGEEGRRYFLGLITLRPVQPPDNGAFLMGLLLWEFFLAYLPFSKMFHMASKYFAYHKSRWSNPYETAKRTV
jgi:nitrate reductase gamma subunit